MDEIKLASNTDERRKTDDMADFYSVLLCAEHLEKAFIRDHISPDEYTTWCKKLISQFKTSEKALQISAADFFIKYNVQLPLAYERLVISGVPATILHNAESSEQKSNTVLVAEATQEFITCMDVLRLDQRAVDEIQPAVASLLSALNKVDKIVSNNLEDVAQKIRTWLEDLNGMRASNDLSDDQVRQLILDLDNSYAKFKAALSS